MEAGVISLQKIPKKTHSCEKKKILYCGIQLSLLIKLHETSQLIVIPHFLFGRLLHGPVGHVFHLKKDHPKSIDMQEKDDKDV